METKFQNRYRIPSIRLPNFDYGKNGMYFVTICIKDHVYILGDIKKGDIHLSWMGKIIKKCWYEIPGHFPFVKLDAFIVMPNHIHGIIIIDKDSNKNGNTCVETLHATSLQLHKNLLRSDYNKTNNSKFYSKISPKLGTLSTIIRSYKSACTKIINQQQDFSLFAWQPRFYDRIIRDEREFYAVRAYIQNNAKNWKHDTYI